MRDSTPNRDVDGVAITVGAAGRSCAVAVVFPVATEKYVLLLLLVLLLFKFLCELASAREVAVAILMVTQ